VLFIASKSCFSQTPDNPLAPQEWVDKMGLGHWWIFTIPPESDNKIRIDNYSPKILDSLKNELGFGGGRLHWNADSFYDSNGELLQSSIDFVETIIDDMLARDMAISLNIQFQTPDEAKNNMTGVKSRMLKAWEKLSKTFKNKSYNLAMCPVIEFHGWENAGISRSQQQDSLNVLYDDLTRIFRKDNPYRIISYKPWGAAKRGEAYTLAFPFGDDPSPNDTEQFYYVSSFSGSAGIGNWQNWTPEMSQEDLDALHFQTINGGSSDPDKLWGLRAMLKHRDDTGIPFWCDHWRPNYHKNEGKPEQWTMEQNIAYSEFWIDKLEEVGSAGAMFQTRTFWNDQTDNFIQQNSNSSNADIMSVMFMDMLRERHDKNSLGIHINENKFQKIKLFPNPTTEIATIQLNQTNLLELKIYTLLSQDVTKKVHFTKISADRVKMNCKTLDNGVYILKIENTTTKLIKI